MVKLYKFEENLAKIARLELFLLQKLSHNGKKRKISQISWPLPKKYQFYGFYFGKIGKTVVKWYEFDENLATIARLQNLLLQKRSHNGEKRKISRIFRLLSKIQI